MASSTRNHRCTYGGNEPETGTTRIRPQDSSRGEGATVLQKPTNIAKALDAFSDREKRRCPRCHKDKPLEMFTRNRRRPEGFANVCRECHAKLNPRSSVHGSRTMPQRESDIPESWECWRTVPGYSGIYEVSDGGHVRRADSHRVLCMNLTHVGRAGGYLKVCLFDRNGTRRTVLVHSLVGRVVPRGAMSR